jgi:hypothetical protein
MAKTPPEPPKDDEEQQPKPRRPSSYTMVGNTDVARMPVPGNAEFLLFLIVWFVLFLIWLFADEVTSGTFATLTVALTFGYMISRGIAKASRVLEH